jgi:hypothetical protein
MLDLTILDSFLLLISCGAKMTYKDFQLAIMWNSLEKAEILPFPCCPLGRPDVSEKQDIQFEVNFSTH